MRKCQPFFVIACASLLACNDVDKNAATKPPAEKQEVSNAKAQILNNIIIQERGGLEIARAFLSNEMGKLLSAKNTTAVGAPVYLNLVIKKGWKAENGKVSISASEKIESDAGEVILEAHDLFKETPFINEVDAHNLQLKAIIQQTLPEISYYVVYYRIWDKKSDAEASGNYRLYVQ